MERVIEEGYLIIKDNSFCRPNNTMLYRTEERPKKMVEERLKSGLWYEGTKVVKAKVVIEE